MSADNCIAILLTSDRWKTLYEGDEIIEENAIDSSIKAYRVVYTYMSSLEGYDWCVENEIHNLGAHMFSDFKKSHVYYDREEAFNVAKILAEKYDYLEYGICVKDMSKFNYPFS